MTVALSYLSFINMKNKVISVWKTELCEVGIALLSTLSTTSKNYVLLALTLSKAESYSGSGVALTVKRKVNGKKEYLSIWCPSNYKRRKGKNEKVNIYCSEIHIVRD